MSATAWPARTWMRCCPRLAIGCSGLSFFFGAPLSCQDAENLEVPIPSPLTAPEVGMSRLQALEPIFSFGRSQLSQHHQNTFRPFSLGAHDRM